MAVEASSQAVSPESYAGGIGAGAVFIGEYLVGVVGSGVKARATACGWRAPRPVRSRCTACQAAVCAAATRTGLSSRSRSQAPQSRGSTLTPYRTPCPASAVWRVSAISEADARSLTT